MSRALVLGGTGHIGAHVVRALLSEGHSVRASYRRERYLGVLEGLPIERARVDLESLEGLDQALESCDWVFHAGGYYPSRRENRSCGVEKGIEVTRRLMERLLAAGPQRVVFTSSAATLRQVPGRLASEEDVDSWPPSQRRTIYATVKIAMEQEVLRAGRAGLPVVIVNPSLCLGEYDARPFSGRAILVFARGRTPFTLDSNFNGVYTGDVGVGHVRAAERGRLGERYLLASRNIALQEFAALVAGEAGVPAPRWKLPYPAVMAAATAAESWAWCTRGEPLLTRDEVISARMGQWLDNSKAVQELAFPQTPIKEAIRRAIAWFRQNGFL